MHALILCLIGLIGLAACAPVESRTGKGADLAIVGADVVPMAGPDAILRDRTILVRDGRIAAIGPSATVRVPAGARLIDGRGKYVMPALTDAHVHLEYFDDPDILRLFVGNGVTTVRNMDGRPFILEWREAVRSGAMVGPRIVTAGPIVDGSPPARDDNQSIADPEAAAAEVRRQAAAGYDFVKVYTNLSPEAYAATAAEAAASHLPVAGHVPRGVALEQALRLQWSIEHLGDFAAAVSADESGTPAWARRVMGAPLDSARLQALARQVAQSGVWVVPTAIQRDRWLAPSAEVERWLAEPAIRNIPAPILAEWRAGIERFAGRMDEDDWALIERARINRLAVIGAFHRAGVRLAVGTDTPNPFVAMGVSVHQELANLVAAGMSPVEALRAATLAPATMLGLDREQGSIEPGKRADLLLLDRNPLDDVAAARRPVGLMTNGRWFTAEELARLRGEIVQR